MRFSNIMLTSFLVLFLSTNSVFSQDIFDAVQKGDIEKIKKLLVENPESVNLKNDNNSSPLLHAVQQKKNNHRRSPCRKMSKGQRAK